MTHYKCACGHWTEYYGLNSGRKNGSKLETCIVGRVNPLRCAKLSEEYKKKDPYWRAHDCPECDYQQRLRMHEMRHNVRDAAARVRDEFGTMKTTRHSHMDVRFQ